MKETIEISKIKEYLQKELKDHYEIYERHSEFYKEQEKKGEKFHRTLVFYRLGIIDTFKYLLEEVEEYERKENE